MTLSTQPYKGARDFYPEDKRLQNYMFTKLSETCRSFGYEEYDAPILEPTELFLAKGNEEIINEQTYTFIDRGGRSVTVRTEMTPSVSRMVAGRRQELGYPLRWFSIPEVWRYERMQRGRQRQFWQLNADIFGISGIEAEHEVIMLADSIMKSFGATPSMYSIRVNSRVLLRHLFTEYLLLNEKQELRLVRLIDRKAKMEPAVFWAAVDELLQPDQKIMGIKERLEQLLAVTLINDLPESSHELAAVQQLIHLDGMLKASGVTNVRFDISLMRGFDYYTDIVFEVFDEDPANNRSMFGGGRYDGLVGMFGVEPVPTVGFGMGDVTLQNFLESHDLLPALQTETDVYVVLVGEGMYEKAFPVLHKLRHAGVHVAVDTSGRNIYKQLKTADKKGIAYALVIGEDELTSEQFKLRELSSGAEETHGLDRLITVVLAARQRDVVEDD